MIALSHLHYHQPLVLCLKDGAQFLYSQIILSIPPLENVSSHTITLNHSYCHSPKTVVPILPPQYPSLSIITPASSNSIQIRVLISSNTPLYSTIRPSGQCLALDLPLGLFFPSLALSSFPLFRSILLRSLYAWWLACSGYKN